MNNRMAAPMKNSAPMIILSWTLTRREWNRKAPMAPGHSQQTTPATAKAMARMTLIAIVRRARGNKVRPIDAAKSSQ
jgi:hypothetical protein